MSYRIAVSSSGKGRRFSPDRNIYSFDPETQDAIGLQKGRNYLEQRLNRPDSGEDAFFVGKVDGHNNTFAFGVADGVGGWMQSGVDPADFSHAFCAYMAECALNWDGSAQELRARALMQLGYERTLVDRSIFAGSSTACIGIAREDGTVQLANLGDSGSVLFRLAAVHHYSCPQTHDFNTPYQLAVLPPLMRMQSAVFGGRQFEDLPQDANVINYRLQHGDVLILATDGVYDNLNNQDILKHVTARMMGTGAWSGTADMGIGVSESLDVLTQAGGLSSAFSALKSKSRHHPESAPDMKNIDANTRDHTLQALLAVTIAGEAKIASMDFRRDGPFAKESQRHRPWDHWRGGKPDDICVIVVIAVEEGRSLAE
ncbi:Protein phosphatase 2C 7 [Ophidiomyces ophidiicola]|uniref:Protein phosphatase 2C 7 n=1 Tax=Ophidiomyces ophidiicola TaxID=1387563 RepID=A0ACB8UUQ9_9EURO|nr:Protein phosphatase 2C 7 [Ophidiomyces ophidiicola]KAI1908709.1 Protein phosphatase 2C 7 [Ophidiomyces ophidiicola]KAI1917197.1 Protein phosphatase 2C 7 [Ophidiomyces ophidiicola]KAI1929682.1 Protein phosphatase 2C 7 [Ophidiomyces ophidiicola]KAI1937487.1 Protein phosphatase 2C 7 [Ophidiomyces ophidiicola]KAI1946518.1 Protein phosphatase 2C 7 [Ophidiomyces ophidiicola]